MLVSNVSLSCARAAGTWCASSDDGRLEAASYRDLSPTGHLVVAVFLGFIGTMGFTNNLLVLVLFCRYQALRSPINLLLVNISVSDLLVCVLGTPFSFAASTQGRWLIGNTGCVWYGFVNSCLGMVSLISLAVLSYERYCTMMGLTEADATNYRKISFGIALSWGYSLLWTLPPLFGWSSYGPEGPGTTCSVNWHANDANNISYIILFFFFCLVVPFLVIIYSYGKLLHAVKQSSGWGEASLIALFCRGLCDDLQAELACKGDTLDLEQLIHLAIRLDNLMRSRGKRSLSATSRLFTRSSFKPSPVTEPEAMQIGRTRLPAEERQRRIQQRLCLYCVQSGHFRDACPNLPGSSSATPQKSVSTCPLITPAQCMLSVRIQLHTQHVFLSALIDLGSAGNFIDRRTAEHLNLPLSPFLPPLNVRAINNQPIGSSPVSLKTKPITMSIGNRHSEKLPFLVIDSPGADIILGHPWFIHHNPIISWIKVTIISWGEHCLSNCLSSPCRATVSRVNTTMGRSRERRVLFMVIIMVTCFLLCWLPYGMVALLATFGRPGLISPEASIIPSILAKSSTAVNPIIYIFMNKQFSRCFRDFMTCQDQPSSSSMKSSSKATKPCRITRKTNHDNFTFVVASAGQPSTFIQNRNHSVGERASSGEASRPVVSLVAHYNG
ncbi:OPSP protein, partial [Amia calva]|nr:OPSP protein [Amia calva]